jgi:precorrin-3B synthase
MTESAPIIQAPVIQGWCPGALRPMESGDGWVVRIRPRAGRLTPAQARGIATLAARFGNGQIDLSARANMQLRGVTTASHAPLIDGLRSLDLLDDTPQAEGQRNVVLSPFWDRQDGAQDVALALSNMLTAPAAPHLPSKFGFAVDMGAAPVLRDIAADIRIESSGSAALIYAQGASTGALAPPDQAAASALRLAQWFAGSGGIGADGRGRMAAHLDRGAALPPEFLAHPVPPAAPYTPRLGPTPQGTLIALEFGQMQAQSLAALADIGALRITPWRMVLVEGAAHIPYMDGLITQPDHPNLRVIACTGAPACTQAHSPTRDLARQLAPNVPVGKTLHVSGCAKGCAHPKPADLTLTATPHGFDLVRAGRAGDTPHATRLTPALIPQALHAP